MAQYTISAGTPYTVFNARFPEGTGGGTHGTFGSDRTVTDSDSGDTNFSFNEAVTYSDASGATGSGTFSGTIEVSGQTYPVFDFGRGFIYVVGIQLNKTTYPNLNSLPARDISNYAVCFCAGTLFRTAHGDRTVEDLSIGDSIRCEDGRMVSVKWIGRQTLRKWQHGAHMQPVRIKAGALDDGLPHSDLTVTADHGMVLDGYVINAAALVNGDTIDFVPIDELEDTFTVYHIETDAHDVILANGAPSETFIDAAGRAAFDNHQEYLDLYGVERIIPEMTMPRIATSRLVPQRVNDRLASQPRPLSDAAA